MRRGYEEEHEEDNLFLALQNMEPCGNCGRSGAKIPCMSGCTEVFYCSRECMMNNASAHRLRCRNLRCSRFNDSDSDEDSDEFSDGDADSDEEWSKKKRIAAAPAVAAAPATPTIAVDSETERRIEEKIMRRLRQQEENRIAMAIEQKMKEHKTGWKDAEMNAIAQKVKLDQVTTTEDKIFRLRNHSLDEVSPPPVVKNSPPAVIPPPPMEEWNNTCPALRALKALVWREGPLGVRFEQNPKTMGFTMVSAVEEPSHITKGDVLITVNGMDVARFEHAPLMELLESASKPTILKFESSNTDSIHEYTVKWMNGPLGLTLKDDGSPESLPIVHRLTNKVGTTALKAGIAIGDILIGINNIDTVALGCILTMSVLKKVQLPAKLHFRGIGGVEKVQETIVVPPVMHAEETNSYDSESRKSSVNSNIDRWTYEINWIDGPLGLTIIPGNTLTDLPLIKRVTGKGTSPGLEQAQVGDMLVSIDGKSIADVVFDSIVEELKHSPKPIRLVFQSSGGGPNSIGNGSEILTSPPAPAPIPASSAFPNAYQVVWVEGPLGLTIDATANGSGAYIKRLGISGATASLTPTVIGDRLVEIAGSNVMDMDFSTIVAYLKAVQRPVRLRFVPDNLHLEPRQSTMMNHRRQSAPVVQSPAPLAAEYQVEWTGGALGLSLHAGETHDALPYIRRLTGTGCAAHLPPSCVGDVLVSVNGESIQGREFLQVMDILKKIPKPVYLLFRPQTPDIRRQSLQQQPPASASSNEQTPFTSSQLHTPFLGGPQLSNRRHQRIVQSVKK